MKKSYNSQKKYGYAIFLIAFMMLHMVKAQVFPVTVTPQAIPPYSLRLSEYGTAQSDKLILNLLLNDITDSDRQVRLKLYVENNAGLSIQSNGIVIGATPIFLEGGVPLRISNADIQAYFALQNLRGVTPQQYSVPLPEGLYRFCFEVYDAQSGQQLSRKSCATVYLVLNDPPFLNLPNRGEQVMIREPQNIIFQWTPRHLNATNVEYEFTLAELWDNQMDPQAAFLASRPIYQTNTFATTLLYGPGETPLLPNKKYGWRVRAIVKDGVSETSIFKNNGYSEINYFTYAESCKEPMFVLARAEGIAAERIQWQGVSHKNYKVQYRKKGSNGLLWFDTETVNPQAVIYDLEPGTTYEFRVGGQCILNGPYTFSQIYEFTTQIAATSVDRNSSSEYNCGITPEIIIENKEPLVNMAINEVFTAGDFPVTVKKVDGKDGVFSGWGYIVVPYLQDTRLKVDFTNIKINKDYQLLEGIVVTDYDSNWGGINDISDEIEAIEETGEVVSETVGDVFSSDEEELPAEEPTDNTTSEETDNSETEEDVQDDNTEEEENSEEEEEQEQEEEEEEEQQEENNEAEENDPVEEEAPEDNTKIWFSKDNKLYGNGETIDVTYDDQNYELLFNAKNYPEKTKSFSWKLSHEGTDRTAEVQKEGVNTDKFTMDLQGKAGDLKLKLIYDENEIEVNLNVIKEKFDFAELTATHNKKRIAKSGEILYVLDTLTPKKVVYDLNLDPKPVADNIALAQDIVWYYNDTDASSISEKDRGRVQVTRVLEANKGMVTQVEAGYPTKVKKEVNIEWVKNKRNKINIEDSKLAKALSTLSDIINTAGKVYNKIAGEGKLKFKVDVGGEEYLSEDPDSRFYFVRRKHTATGEIEYDIPDISYGYSIGEHVKLKVTLDPTLLVRVNGSLIFKKRNDKGEKDEFIRDHYGLGFNVKSDLVVKGDVGIDFDDNLEIGVYPEAGISTWGGIEYQSETNALDVSIGIGQPYVSIRFELNTFGVNLLPESDYNHTWEDVKFEANKTIPLGN